MPGIDVISEALPRCHRPREARPGAFFEFDFMGGVMSSARTRL